MPNCGRRTFRSLSPCWCNVNRSRRKPVPFRPVTCRPISNPIGEQLLLTLVQSISPIGMNVARSPSFSPSPYRRRVRTNYCPCHKKPVIIRLHRGMPVREVSGQDRIGPTAPPLQAKPFNSFAVDTFIKRHRESSMAKVKAREKEYERIPKLKPPDKKECVMTQVKAREEAYERIPKIRERKKRLCPMALAKAREEEYESIPRIKGGKKSEDPRGSQEASNHSITDIPQSTPKRTENNTQEGSIHSINDIVESSSKLESQRFYHVEKNISKISHSGSQEGSIHSIEDILPDSPLSEQMASNSEEKNHRKPIEKSGPRSHSSPRSVSNPRSQTSPRSQSSPRSQNSPKSQKGHQKNSRSQDSDIEVSYHSVDDLKISVQKTVKKVSKNVADENRSHSPRTISNKSNRRNSRRGIQDDLQENHSPEHSQNDSIASNVEEEPEEPPAPVKEQSMKTKGKIFPCFRGEYPTRHCKGSYLWFEGGVPNCGKLVTICDGGQQVLGQAEILTACEVTESHYLEMDDENPDCQPPTANSCKKCRHVMCGYPMQQQEQDMNCFASLMPKQFPCRQQQQVPCRQQQQLSCRQQQQLSCRQPQLPCRQQPVSGRQKQIAIMNFSPSRISQQSPVGRERSPVGQQQRSSNGAQQSVVRQRGSSSGTRCGQQQSLGGQRRPSVGQQQSSFGQQASGSSTKRSNCRQTSPHKVCWKCQDEQQQQQETIPCSNYGMNEMLAEELKQQMHEAQAQIAKVQQQLNSVCACAPVNCYVPQCMMEQDGDEEFVNYDDMIVEEPTQQLQEQRMGRRPCSAQQQQIQFGYCPVALPMTNQSQCFQDQAMPLRMTFSCHQLPPCQQQLPLCQQQLPPCQQQVPPCRQPVSCYRQQVSSSRQQVPPCQQDYFFQQELSPCQLDYAYQQGQPFQEEMPPQQEELPPGYQELSAYQEEPYPFRQGQTPFSEESPPFQQEPPSIQQEQPSIQQEPPPCQQQLSLCKQQKPSYPFQQQCCKAPCQEQEPCPCQQNQTPSSSQPNMFSHAPHCCPSCYTPRFAQMRFMMPRRWPR